MVTRLVMAVLVILGRPMGAMAVSGLDLTPRGLDELQLMTVQELAAEATNACIFATMSAHQAARASEQDLPGSAVKYHAEAQRARDYLERIAHVVRKKAGRTPQWMADLTRQGWETGGQQRCVEIYKNFLAKGR